MYNLPKTYKETTIRSLCSYLSPWPIYNDTTHALHKSIGTTRDKANIQWSHQSFVHRPTLLFCHSMATPYNPVHFPAFIASIANCTYHLVMPQIFSIPEQASFFHHLQQQCQRLWHPEHWSTFIILRPEIQPHTTLHQQVKKIHNITKNTCPFKNILKSFYFNKYNQRVWKLQKKSSSLII